MWNSTTLRGEDNMEEQTTKSKWHPAVLHAVPAINSRLAYWMTNCPHCAQWSALRAEVLHQSRGEVGLWHIIMQIINPQSSVESKPTANARFTHEPASTHNMCCFFNYVLLSVPKGPQRHITSMTRSPSVAPGQPSVMEISGLLRYKGFRRGV